MTKSVTRDVLQEALAKTVDGTNFHGLGKRYVGKVRDNYSTDGGRRFIVVTDRISAFDRVLGTLPFKGQVLNRIATWWFSQTKGVAPNHMVREVDPNIVQVVECAPLPVEMVVRAYLTGVSSTSIWTHYQRGVRTFCGHALPEGLRFNERLPDPILTPSTKALQGDHDVSASRDEILAMGHISVGDFDKAADMAMKLFAFGQKICAQRGLILVDTKYEFGKAPDGSLVVIDEIHTPDSSRFWYAEPYESRFATGEGQKSFDKEYLRRWLVDRGFRGDGDIPFMPDDVRIEAALRYVEIYEAITGQPFEPDLREPQARMRQNLGLGATGTSQQGSA
ncbi:MAG: phosphoribosylaminoimidazolesuccinocarboxamide synthase [Polyangiaceae bacterium]|jgi:phosphoribosylaminoimidazole-succinocarboxamide synthase|nr:phosphoribosylaminoimidazolesuccinocarboxamide synthase [Polyangiaceae bacterium]